MEFQIDFVAAHGKTPLSNVSYYFDSFNYNPIKSAEEFNIAFAYDLWPVDYWFQDSVTNSLHRSNPTLDWAYSPHSFTTHQFNKC